MIWGLNNHIVMILIRWRIIRTHLKMDIILDHFVLWFKREGFKRIQKLSILIHFLSIK